MTNILDLRQRQRALEPHESFIVEAPAGSGKTELLTQRLLTLLTHCQQPEEILAITFTRKAAAEMRHRVLTALALAEQAEPAQAHAKQTWTLARSVLQHDAERAWNLRLAPQRLQIFTFDSLCARIAKALPLHSRLGAVMEISEDADALYQQAVERLFTMLDSENALRPALMQLLRHRDNNFDDLRELFVAMLAKRDAWLPLLGGGQFGENHQQRLQNHLVHLIEDYLQKVDSALAADLRAELRELIGYAHENFQKDYPDKISPYADWFTNAGENFPKPQADELERWKALTYLLLTSTGSVRKRISKVEGFPPAKGPDKAFHERMKSLLADLSTQAVLIENLREIKILPGAHYSDYQWQILNSLTALLPVLVAQFKVVCAAYGKLDFSEISQAALAALGGEDAPSDIALRLDYRINHILVDEFQDTSTSQILMLEKLTDGWQQGDGRTLFCVGDAMQSIYSFRNARVSLFLACKQHGLGSVKLEALQLSANFRSHKNLVDWNNAVFTEAFPAYNDIGLAAVAYTPAQAVLPETENSGVVVHGWNEDEPRQEAAKIVEIVQQTQARDPHASIAILLRKRAHANHILPALQYADIPYQAIELGSLASTSTVQDLQALTHALLDATDRIAWLAVLRAPWCGLSLSELESLATSGMDEEHPDPLPVIKQIPRYLQTQPQATLQRVYHCLRHALQNRQRLPLRQWLQGCWREIGGEACLQNAEERLNALAYFNEIEKLETQFANELDINIIDRAIARQFAAANPSADSRLQIMTMHKSKGLEFDVVILPSLHTSKELNDNELLQWQDRIRDNGDQEILLAPIQAIEAQVSDGLFDYLKAQKKKRKILEDSRLLYVACTRAKKQLYLLGGLKPAKDDPANIASPAANSFLARLAPHIEQYFSVPPATRQENSFATTQTRPRRLPAGWHTPDLQTYTHLENLIPRLEYSEEEQSLDLQWQDSCARHVGTLVHAVLCDMHVRGLALWQQRLRTEKAKLQQIWRAALLELGLPVSQTATAARRIGEILEACFSQDNFQWLFSATHKQRLSEYSLSLKLGNKSVTLIVDLILLDSNGVLWVIDYKTSAPEANQNLDVFLAAEKAIYREKMQLYRKAVATLPGYQQIKEIKVALYFPVCGKLEEF